MLALLGVLAFASLAQPAEPAEAADACAPVAILAFRGSSQDNLVESVKTAAGRDYVYSGTALVTNGWEGPTLSRLIATVARSVSPQGLRGDSIPVIGVGPSDDTRPWGYPAVGVWREVTNGLTASALKGAAAAQELVADFKRKQIAAGCSRTARFIAAGYSQGAMAARYAAIANPQDIVGVLSAGDPLQKPFADGVGGSGADGGGFVRWDVRSNSFDQFYSVPGLIRKSVCHTDDPICDYYAGDGIWGGLARSYKLASALDFSDGAHYTYFRSPQEALEYADITVRMAEQIALANGASPASWRTSDVVIAVDRSSSYAGHLSGISRIADAMLTSTYRQTRIAIVEYGDRPGADGASVLLPFTADHELVLAQIRGLSPTDHDGPASAAYPAIAAAAGLDWAEGASRSIIVLGDAPPAEPGPGDEHTAESLTDLLLAGGEADDAAALGARSADPTGSTAADDPDAGPPETPIVLYSIGADPALGDGLAPIVDSTGGLSLDAPDPGDLPSRIDDVVADIATAPAAALGAVGPPTEGEPLALTAVGSYGADLDFAFDLDGDGDFETEGGSGVVTLPAMAAGTATVAARIVDERGRASIGPLTLEIAPAPVEQLPDLDSPGLTVAVEGDSLRAGEPVRLTVGTAAGAPPVTPSSSYGVLLVPRSGADSGPWDTAPAHEAESVPADDGVAEVDLPAQIPAGEYWLTAVGPDGSWGSAALTVDGGTDPGPGPDGEPAALALSAVRVAAGSTLGVGGSGFAPGATLELWLHSTPVRVGTVAADASGSFSTRVAIPASTEPGAHRLVVRDSAGASIAEAALRVDPAAAGTASGTLSRTGGPDVAIAAWAAVGLLAAGAGALLLPGLRRGRRRPNPRQAE